MRGRGERRADTQRLTASLPLRRHPNIPPPAVSAASLPIGRGYAPATQLRAVAIILNDPRHGKGRGDPGDAPLRGSQGRQPWLHQVGRHDDQRRGTSWPISQCPDRIVNAERLGRRAGLRRPIRALFMRDTRAAARRDTTGNSEWVSVDMAVVPELIAEEFGGGKRKQQDALGNFANPRQDRDAGQSAHIAKALQKTHSGRLSTSTSSRIYRRALFTGLLIPRGPCTTCARHWGQRTRATLRARRRLESLPAITDPWSNPYSRSAHIRLVG